MSVCRNLNPFTSSGKHCSAPSGICFSTSDGRNIVGGFPSIIRFIFLTCISAVNNYIFCPITSQNLGHMTKPPSVEKKDSDAVIVLDYVDGDQCATDGSKKYSTRVTLVCGTSQEQVCDVGGPFLPLPYSSAAHYTHRCIDRSLSLVSLVDKDYSTTHNDPQQLIALVLMCLYMAYNQTTVEPEIRTPPY